MRKIKILISIFAIAMLIGTVFTLKSSAAVSGYYTCSVSGGKATITDVNASISGNITIPSTIGGYPVTSIGDYAFSYCKSLTSVVIPGGVTSIGDCAFYGCERLTSVVIPRSVTSIGDYAFSYCALQSVYINDLKAWCELDFSSSLRELYLNGTLVSGDIIIPDGTKKIRAYAFADCHQITSITIPNSVTSIGDRAFLSCDSLTSVVIPDSVTSIGEYAFNSCSRLSNVEIQGSPSIGSSAFRWISSYNDGIITFLQTPSSLADSEYTIDEDVTIYCYADNTTVKNYAKKYSREIVILPCKGGCTFDQKIADDKYLKSAGSCTEKAAYYKSCVCGRTNQVDIFYADYVHSFSQEWSKDDTYHWYDCLNCSAKDSSSTHTYSNISDASCNVCSYERLIFTLNYDANGGSGAPSSQSAAKGSSITVSSGTPTRSKYIFEGWATTPSGTVKYKSGATITLAEDTILYAVWGEPVTVTYDANGGSGAPSSQTVAKGSSITVSSQTPTRSGYAFAGWAVSKGGDIKNTHTVTEDITLYAVWVKSCPTCGGDGKCESAERCTFCKSGYIYSSSCYYCNGSGKYYVEDQYCSICSGTGWRKDPLKGYVKCTWCGGYGYTSSYQTCTRCRNVCVFCGGDLQVPSLVDCENCDAKGYLNTFDVYYDANGGTGAPATQTMGEVNDTLSTTIPIRQGYTFVGWVISEDSDTVYQPGGVYSGGEVTFFAKWKPTCRSCLGVGHFTENTRCDYCGGDGEYKETVSSCNNCGGTRIQGVTTGVGSVRYCFFCLSTSIKTTTTTYTCYECTNGYIKSSYDCETCDGNGYVDSLTTGDIDGDEVITVDDAIYLAFYTFYPDRYPLPNGANVDFDKDGVITVDDAIYLAFYTFYPDRYPLN